MDADDDEKILAMKTAYADVISNISKETAARVMASERRAALCQHEMKMSKEESLRMLMRMKHMMDSKISEGEATSLHQKKKIVELEAQLQEAEDIVRDLREELAEVQAELQSVKNGGNLHFDNEMPLDITDYSNHHSLQNQRQVCHKCYNELGCTCGLYIQNRDLPSIILRGKDSKLYRNGRKRIRACERNGLGGETGLSGTTAEARKLKEDKEMPEAPLSCTKTTSGTDLANVRFGSSQSFLCKRKRAARRRKPVRALNGNVKMDRVPLSIKDGAFLVENPSLETWTLSSDPVITEASETEKNLVENVDQCKDGDSNVKLLPSEDKNGFSQGLCLSDHGKSIADKDEVQFQSAEDPSELNEVSPSQSAREREIKYTFQRKRKRPAQEGSEAKNTVRTETKASAKQDNAKKSEQSKSNPSMESSRECRRMAQVARQLLSLSERKWWD